MTELGKIDPKCWMCGTFIKPFKVRYGPLMCNFCISRPLETLKLGKEKMAKEATCRDCETIFELPIQRGRPAVRCVPCRTKTPTVMQFSKNTSTGTKEIVELKVEVQDGVTWIENAEPCEDCGITFMRPRKRGRPPKKCENCSKIAADAKAAVVTVSEETLDQLFKGAKALLKGTPGERPRGAEAQCPTTGKCGRIFTSNSSCDLHKKWLPNGSYECLDPATLGMEPRERRGIPVWTRPTPIEGV